MDTIPSNQDKKPSVIKKPAQPKRRRRLGGLFNLLLLVAIIGVVAMFVRAEQDRRQAREELTKTAQQLEELKNSTQTSGQQVAQEVLNKVRNHIDLPTEPAPTVATITDIERLRQSNEFYNKAKNGDHLIITEERAVLYDPNRDIVIDVVPVRITPTSTPPANTAPVPSTSSSPLSTASPLASPSASPATGNLP